jgi:uncharacterized oxidoreductase
MPRIEPARLEAFLTELAAAVGTPSDQASNLAASLVAADLCGHSSHGSRLLPVKYVPEIVEGKIVPEATPRILRDDGVFVSVDGRKAFGQVAIRDAIDKGIATAEQHGIGVVTLRNVSHIGRVGEWAERATESGMSTVGFVSNPGSRWVAPPGSTQRRFSTNPVVVGLPTFDALPFPLVLDVATSQVARGKIRKREMADEPLPDGWAVDESGGSLVDGTAFKDGDGAILPLGGFVTGHKGFGLAAMSELMAGNASDGSVSGMADVTWGNHALFYITDIERCTTREALESRVVAFQEYLCDTNYADDISMPSATTGNRTLLPGEAEHRARESRTDAGIPLGDGVATVLRDLAAEHGIDETVPQALR